MKVLVISHEYPPIGGGGGKVVQDLCAGLAGRGHQIHLLTALWEDLPEKESIRQSGDRKAALRQDPILPGGF